MPQMKNLTRNRWGVNIFRNRISKHYEEEEKKISTLEIKKILNLLVELF